MNKTYCPGGCGSVYENYCPGCPKKAIADGNAADHHAEDVKRAVEHLANLPKSALDTQVGGTHYKGKGIQPIEYIHANGLNFSEGSIVKYITRWRDKGGVKDLEKIKHYVDLLIEMEKKYGTLDSELPEL